MFRFVEQIAISALMLFSSLLSINSLECVAMKNQECRVRPEIVDVSVIILYFILLVLRHKCSGNCNNINDPYARTCVPDTVKNLNVEVFNLMTFTNETRHIKWHESCKCICSLNGIICHKKQQWNEDKCRCECEELIDKGLCDKGFTWNPSNCECECDKSCDIGKYLDYSNCKCRKKLVDPLIEECTENIDETKIFNITLAENENSYHKCNSCKVYIIFMTIIFTIFTGITIYFIYYNWSLIRSNISCIKFNTRKETEIW